MDSALWTAKSGLEVHHKNIAIISHNLANANTTAFKKGRAEFADNVYQVLTQPGAATSESSNSPSGAVLGTGVKIAAIKKIFTDGSLIQTDNALDLSISGRGFFKIQIPNQSDFAYTRSGSFQVNDQGQLVSPNGYLLEPAITIPQGAQQIQISEDGIVSVSLPNTTTPEQIGQLELNDFINPAGLQAIGDNLYKETVASGSATASNPTINGFGKLQQGTLESSNVNIVEEMVNLIEAQRSFEVTSKAVSAIDKMFQDLDKNV